MYCSLTQAWASVLAGIIKFYLHPPTLPLLSLPSCSKINSSPDSSKFYGCELFIKEYTFLKPFLFLNDFYFHSIFWGCQEGGTGIYDPNYGGLMNNIFRFCVSVPVSLIKRSHWINSCSLFTPFLSITPVLCLLGGQPQVLLPPTCYHYVLPVTLIKRSEPSTL